MSSLRSDYNYLTYDLVHLEIFTAKLEGIIIRVTIFYGAKHSEATYMCVLAAHMVPHDDHLQDVRIHRFETIAVLIKFRRDVERDPPVRLFESDAADVLEVAGARARANGERRGGVGIVEGKTEMYAEFLDSNFPGKLNGDEMGLRAVRMPESVWIAVTQAFCAETELGRGYGPFGAA